MTRAVPLWLVLFLFLIFAMGTVAFGALVKAELEDREGTGRLGDIALTVADFPNIARAAYNEASAHATGHSDRFLLVPSQEPEREGFEPLPADDDLALPGLLIRADRDAVAPGWRMLVGAYDGDGRYEHGAVLISPELRAVHTWTLDEPAGEGIEPAPRHRRFLHGLALLPDGSVIFAFDGGKSLQKVDVCGAPVWQIAGDYHHAVTLAPDGESVWTLQGDALVEVATADGAVVQRMHVEEIIAANPDTDILEVRRFHRNDISGNGRHIEDSYLLDPWHFNDVDPLPPEMANAFPAFDAGDLLVSSRSLNLVFVVDPDTKRIKWWRMGAWKRQHDPDWLENGRISVFDNQMNRDWSRIVEIAPDTFDVSVPVPGEPSEFYTRIRGKHQTLPTGHRFLAVSQQGRALELGPDGEVVLELLNLKSANTEAGYTLSDYFHLPVDAVDFPMDCAPPTARLTGGKETRQASLAPLP